MAALRQEEEAIPKETEQTTLSPSSENEVADKQANDDALHPEESCSAASLHWWMRVFRSGGSPGMGMPVSTKTFGSLIRSRSFGVSAVYTVSLRLACRTPQCVGAGSCSPFERWIGRMMSPLSDGGSVFGCPWRHLHPWRCGGEGSTCCLIYQHRDDRRERWVDQRYGRIAG